jgi:hypothetical protein
VARKPDTAAQIVECKLKFSDLIDAVAGLRQERQAALLACVGAGKPAEAKELDERIRALSLEALRLELKRRVLVTECGPDLPASPNPPGRSGPIFIVSIAFSGRTLSASLCQRSELIAGRLIRSEIEFTGAHDAAMRLIMSAAIRVFMWLLKRHHGRARFNQASNRA